MSTVSADVDDDGDADGEPYSFTAEMAWDFKISHAQGTVRKFMMESAAKDMMFMGAASPKGISELLEMPSMLAAAGPHYFLDFNDLCSGGTACRPWAYEMICADDSDALREGVAPILRNCEAFPEVWVVCAHYAHPYINVSLLTAATTDADCDDSPTLDCTLKWKVRAEKDALAGESFRVLFFGSSGSRVLLTTKEDMGSNRWSEQ